MAKESQPMIFGRYEVIGEVGHGSMGMVYKARDPVIGRLVAVKTIPETFGLSPEKREEFILRLRQEAITAGRLQHSSIVTIHDVGEGDYGPYIAMEYLDGVTLREVITSGRSLNLAQMAEVISQACEGLDYAHKKAVIHRDIKPSNIMIVDGSIVKIMDLGIARIPMSELTKEGKLVGSPSYMAPEQLRGEEIDGRSDLFSLGVVVYQCMTLRKPFPGEDINQICYRIVHEDFVSPSQHMEFEPEGFEYFLAKALAKNPDDRFQTGAEFSSAFASLLQDNQESATEITGRTGTVASPVARAEDMISEVTSNPNLTQVTTIDTIFKDLTSTARSFDLEAERSSSFMDYWWIIPLLALAAMGGFWFFTRS